MLFYICLLGCAVGVEYDYEGSEVDVTRAEMRTKADADAAKYDCFLKPRSPMCKIPAFKNCLQIRIPISTFFILSASLICLKLEN